MSDKKEDASAAEVKKAVVEEVAKEEPVKDVEESSAKRPAPDAPEASKKDAKDDGGEWFTSGAMWGASWVQSAKQKTLSTLEMVKKDLNEFTDTVQNEATALASATAESVKHQAQLFQQFVTTPDGADEQEPGETAKEAQEPASQTKEGEAEPEKKEAGGEAKGFGFGWMKTVVDAVQKLAIEDTTQDEEEFTEKLSLPRKTLLDQCQLLQLQNDERTFLTAPSQNVDLYRDWLEDFRISEYNGEINILLGYNPRLREIYAKLVPAQVDNHTFWNRYFFKVHVAELDKELHQKPEKGQEKVFEELKVNTETVPRSVEASPAGTEKDETWSIVSNNTSSGDASEPEHVSSDDVTERAGAQTPKAAENGDDWEECEEESTA